jgi:hypothetical protein
MCFLACLTDYWTKSTDICGAVDIAGADIAARGYCWRFYDKISLIN